MAKTLTVFKYLLPKLGGKSIDLPSGASILSIQQQRDQLTMWALVDETAPMETRAFYVAMTGESIKIAKASNLRFLDTVQFNAGIYVVHVFEVLK